jgi:uncharacterized protein (TIGR00288 family)
MSVARDCNDASAPARYSSEEKLSAQFAHAPHRGSMPMQQQTANHPHAALLIDFDNVTMGIRSDLSKELKNLLSSDIIKGKVAVQRAYADWRRYPQYIVPLAESSVDLIFAPAYGSSKKNATDIRLAIDALELVFTRPEIGSFILLSGDSDFSSLVLKLKEYGKYVIGVGIRESASDLLVQNCDEYYSYSALTGLTRAGDEPRDIATQQDPWELVEIAVNQMAENDDVMRSDRLKQVMLEMDPTFDEKALGFQKFNRFMQDAAARGMVSLKKLENGQFEIGVAAPGARAEAEEEEQRGNGQRARRSRRGGRGRGRGSASSPEASVESSVESSESSAEVSTTESVHATSEDTASSEPVAEQGLDIDATEEAPDVITAIAPVTEAAADAGLPRAEAAGVNGSRGRRGRGRGRGRGGSAEAGVTPPVASGSELPPLEKSAERGDASLLKEAYALLRKATKEVLARGGSTARDSDVKRRMLELQADWDEHPLGFSKFSRFLRQAHDAEVINLHKTDTGYDLTMGDSAGGASGSGREAAPRTGKTGRGSEREAAPNAPQRPARHAQQGGLFESVAAKTDEAAGAIEAPLGSQVTHAADVRTSAPFVAASAPQPAASAAQASQSSSSSQPASSATPTIGFRRGSSRGRGAPSGPPPLLEGQTVAPVRSAADASVAVTTAATAAPIGNDAADARTSHTTKNARGAAKETANESIGKFASLGFPTKANEIATYLSEYKGVGPKSIQTLIDTFGATHVFDALQNRADRVREVVPGARGETLLDAWNDDYTLRKAQSTPPEKQKAPAEPAKRAARKGAPRGPGRGPGRGGSGAGAGGAKRGGASSGAKRGGPAKRGGRKGAKRT